MTEETWHARDVPVLLALVERYAAGDKVVKSNQLTEMTGLSAATRSSAPRGCS